VSTEVTAALVIDLRGAALVGLMCSTLAGCTRAPDLEESGKIEFDLTAADDRGLIGPPDGLRAISYEFCVPDDSELLEEVRSIDANVEMQGSSPGRIGCGATEVLCLSHTAQSDYREVVEALAALDYVDRIIEAHFE